ncbi:MAG TPA: metallophosphoesterase [Bacteroidia bacterium]|jgi:calcineurin-like phosphoesterase family protein|nr:metallophosphoesterase [Bacteroidia bacterium]
METFFIGDTHFGHKNILKYEPNYRKFNSIEEHDAELIKRWNAKVTNKDTVYHLGDFCFGRHNIDIASELNGIKKLIMGNHDLYDVIDYRKYFVKVYGVFAFKNILLSHMPCIESEGYELNIHGHLHSKMLAIKNEHKYFNVSCENINLTPISLDEINIKRYNSDYIYK